MPAETSFARSTSSRCGPWLAAIASPSASTRPPTVLGRPVSSRSSGGRPEKPYLSIWERLRRVPEDGRLTTRMIVGDHDHESQQRDGEGEWRHLGP